MSMIIRNEVVALGGIALAAMTYWNLSSAAENKLIRAQSGQPLPQQTSLTPTPISKKPTPLPPLVTGMGGRNDLL